MKHRENNILHTGKKWQMLWLLTALTLVLCTGCGDKKAQSQEADDSSENQTTGNTTEPDSKTEDEDTASDYQVQMLSYENTEMHKVEYPAISGLKDSSIQKKINDYFYQDTDSMMKEYYGEKDQIEQTYEVTLQNSNMLSMVCRGSEYGEGAAHPYAFCKSYTIDMTTGELMTLKDYGDTAKLADKLLHSTECIVDVDYDLPLADILEFNFMGQPEEDLLKASLEHFDMDYEMYGQGECIGYSYVKDNGNICLIFSVSHAAGDYVVVEVPGCTL